MVSLTDLKLQLKVDSDQTAEDTLIIAMEQAAVAYLQNETGKYFGPVAEITEVVGSAGWGPIVLQAAPEPDSIYTPILVERRASVAGDYAAATDYEIDGQRLYPQAFWSPAARALRITYWGGYAEGNEPADVQQAVRELVARMWRYRLPFVEGAVLADLPASVHDVIRAHKTIVV